MLSLRGAICTSVGAPIGSLHYTVQRVHFRYLHRILGARSLHARAHRLF